jgi:hypothetical protein
MKKNINLNQLPLPFLPTQAGAGRRAYALSYDDRAKLFWFLAGAFLFALATYVYAVNATAHHVAERAALEREAANLSAEIATLEFEAIALKNDITIEVARSYGFTEVEKPLYVSAEKAGSLSFNAERP